MNYYEDEEEYDYEEEEDLEPLAPQPGKQELALNIQADVIWYGGAAGSSKTFTILLRSLMHVHDRHYAPIYFRRETNMIEGQGGLFTEALEMYRRFKVKPKGRPNFELRFPHPNLLALPKLPPKINKWGSKIKFSHLQNEGDEQKHLGLQYSAIFFDELPTFTEKQFLFMCSRLRSKAKMKPYVFCTMNPDYDSWCYNWVEWYLLECGLPDPEKCAKIRYFLIVDGKPKFADTEEALAQEYPHMCWLDNPNTGEKLYVPPKTFTFISANIYDNPKLMISQPGYIQNLMSQDEVMKQRMLFGNWKTRDQGTKYFSRDWLTEADVVPYNVTTVRAWDKAASEPSPKEWRPDYTAGSPKISKTNDGKYYIVWDFHQDIKDPNTEVTGRFRLGPGDRDRLIEKQAKYDGSGVKVVFNIDPGSAGKSEFQQAAAKLTSKGFTVIADPMAHNAAKLTKFTPFSSACKNGLVYIVKDSFPNKETYEEYCKELEMFDGKGSTRALKDDWVDATASAFNALNTTHYIGVPAVSDTSQLDSLINPLITSDIYGRE